MPGRPVGSIYSLSCAEIFVAVHMFMCSMNVESVPSVKVEDRQVFDTVGNVWVGQI